MACCLGKVRIVTWEEGSPIDTASQRFLLIPHLPGLLEPKPIPPPLKQLKQPLDGVSIHHPITLAGLRAVGIFVVGGFQEAALKTPFHQECCNSAQWVGNAIFQHRPCAPVMLTGHLVMSSGHSCGSIEAGCSHTLQQQEAKIT